MIRTAQIGDRRVIVTPINGEAVRFMGEGTKIDASFNTELSDDGAELFVSSLAGNVSPSEWKAAAALYPGIKRVFWRRLKPDGSFSQHEVNLGRVP